MKTRPPLTIATWNVDSIRARVPRVADWLARHRPDAICFQETKCPDDTFPRAELEKVGYRVETFGEKGRNGVAIASREPLAGVARGIPGEDEDAQRRVISGKLGEVEIFSVYVPNGQAIGADEYFRKIDWLVRFREFLRRTRRPEDPIVILGDFNIAPDDRDIYDPRLRGGLHCSKPERDALGALMQWGLVDALRAKTDAGGQFTWWGYGVHPFKRNEGLRIDLCLATAPLVPRIVSVAVDRDERGSDRLGVKASDHAPVVASFAP